MESLFIATESGQVLMTPEDAQAFEESRKPLPPTEAEYVFAIQSYLDLIVRERGYDGIISACSYYNSTNNKFSAEANACIAWRDSVWLKAIEIKKQIDEGVRNQPSIDEFLSELPEIVWP